MNDLELLEQFRQGSADAFSAIVRRHVNWVYSAAKRRVRDAHLAEDVTQAVFITLAQKTPYLRRGSLSPWLFGVLIRVSKTAIKRQAIRQRHESEAAKMRPTTTPDPQADWNSIAPNLEEAVAKLRFADQQAILLRFYEQLSFAEVGTTLGITEEAARKRVSRAVDSLRRYIVGPRSDLSQSALSILLLSSAAKTAPDALVNSIFATVSIALNAGSAAVTTKGGLLMLAMGKAKLGVLASVLILVVAAVSVVPRVGSRATSRSLISGSSSVVPGQPAWQTEFEKVYFLAPGENAKLIKPAQFPSARDNYGKQFYPRVANTVRGPYTVKFLWDGPTGKLKYQEATDGPYSLRALIGLWGIITSEVEIAPQLEKLEVSGDWILRADPATGDTPLVSSRQAVLDILNRELKRSIQLTSTDEEREVLVVRGTLQPLLSENNGLLVLGAEGEAPFGQQFEEPLSGILKFVSAASHRPLFDESGAASIYVKNSRSKSFGSAHYDTDPAALEALLKNLSRQTGLQFSRERRVITVWKLDEPTLDGARSAVADLPPDKASFILNALQLARERVPPLGYEAVWDATIDPEVSGRMSPPAPLRIHSVQRVRQSGKSRMSDTVLDEEFSDRNSNRTVAARTLVTDGTAAYWIVGDRAANQRDHASISAMDSDMSTLQNMYSGGDVFSFGFAIISDTKTFLTYPGNEIDVSESPSEDGRKLLQVNMSFKIGGGAEFVMDPAKGFLITHLAQMGRANQIVRRVEVTPGEIAPGVWIPVHVHETDSARGRETEIAVRDIEVNPRIDRDAFRIEKAFRLPQGTLVFQDRLNGTTDKSIVSGEGLIPYDAYRTVHRAVSGLSQRVAEEVSAHSDMVAPSDSIASPSSLASVPQTRSESVPDANNRRSYFYITVSACVGFVSTALYFAVKLQKARLRAHISSVARADSNISDYPCAPAVRATPVRCPECGTIPQE